MLCPRMRGRANNHTEIVTISQMFIFKWRFRCLRCCLSSLLTSYIHRCIQRHITCWMKNTVDKWFVHSKHELRYLFTMEIWPISTFWRPDFRVPPPHYAILGFQVVWTGRRNVRGRKKRERTRTREGPPYHPSLLLDFFSRQQRFWTSRKIESLKKASSPPTRHHGFVRNQAFFWEFIRHRTSRLTLGTRREFFYVINPIGDPASSSTEKN